MKLDTKLKVLIKKAIEIYACDYSIKTLKSLGDVTLDDIKNHPKSPEWAFWYAECVIEGRWPEAENIIKNNPKWDYMYETLFNCKI